MHTPDLVAAGPRADAHVEADRAADLLDPERGKLGHVSDKSSLPQLGPEKLGAPTIMDRALAARHGVPYVHLVAFAIDVDRVRAEAGDDDARPFAWEVFLVERFLVERFDPNRQPEQVLLFEDIVLGVLDGAADVLGTQVVFAIWDLVQRGRFPHRLEGAFAGWPERPDGLAEDLDVLFADEATHAASLARTCLAAPLDPPLAPPTREALEAMAK